MMEIMAINVTSAGYAPCYDPSAANNGGGYWQPSGTCDIVLDDGTVIKCQYDDTSCGDYGDRWDIVLTCADERWIIHADYVGTDAETQEDNRCLNAQALDQLSSRFGIDAGSLIAGITRAIDSAARDIWRTDWAAEADDR